VSDDTLSDLLRTVRLTGAVFFDMDVAAPWSKEQPAGAEIASSVLPGVQHLISFHAVTEGSCYGGIVGTDPVHLDAGDVIVFPHGDGHVMSSAPELTPSMDRNAYRIPASQLPMTIKLEGDPKRRTRIICGFLGCDVRPFNPLISALPRVLHVRDGNGGGWLGNFMRVALTESQTKRSGGESVLARMSELMFVEAVRRHLESLPPEQTGWLAGLRDPQVARALALLHGRPGFGWTLPALAREAGLSRSALAERFTHLIGHPPIQYLANWRMQVAAGLLVRGDKVASVALEVGYDSEAAFSRAFKKLIGRSPRTWRAEQGLAETGARSAAQEASRSRVVAVGSANHGRRALRRRGRDGARA